MGGTEHSWFIAILKSSQAHIARFLIRAQSYPWELFSAAYDLALWPSPFWVFLLSGFLNQQQRVSGGKEREEKEEEKKLWLIENFPNLMENFRGPSV